MNAAQMGNAGGAAWFVLLLGLFGLSRVGGSVVDLLRVCPECAPTLALVALLAVSAGVSWAAIHWLSRPR